MYTPFRDRLMERPSQSGLQSGQAVAMLVALISVPFVIAVFMMVQQRLAVQHTHAAAADDLALFQEGLAALDPLSDMRDLAAVTIHTQHPEIVSRYNLSQARAASRLQGFLLNARLRDVPGLNEQAALLGEAWSTLTVKTGIPLEDVVGPFDNVNQVNERLSNALSTLLFVSELSNSQGLGPNEVLSLPLGSFRVARENIGLIRALALYVSFRGGYLGDNDARRLENAWQQLNHQLTIIDSEIKALVARTGAVRLQQQWHLVQTEVQRYLGWVEEGMILAPRVELDWEEAYDRGHRAMHSLSGMSEMLVLLASRLHQVNLDQQLRRNTLQIAAVMLLYAMLLGLALMLYRYNSRAIRARAENRAKDLFLARMSHEIRTPLNGVIGLAELLRETGPSPRQQEYIGLIETAGRTLNTLVNDVLDYSKIEAGKLDLVAEPFDLPSLMVECAQMFNLQASDNDTVVVLDVDELCPSVVVGDAIRLRQVLINLLGNAVKFTRRGRVVLTLSSRKNAGETPLLTFAVTDTGIGLSPEEQSRLFQRFSQASPDTARHYGGTGLGLSISRELVALMGGEISVKSAPGKGARFSFSIQLPVEQDAVPMAQVPAPPAWLWDYQGSLRDWLNDDPRFAAIKTLVPGAPLPELDATKGAPILLVNGLPPLTVLEEQLAVAASQCPDIHVVLLVGMRYEKPEGLPDRVSLLRRSVLTVHELLLLFSGASMSVPPVLTRRQVPERTAELRVLVAEDNPVNQMVTRGYLERLGVNQIDIAADGALALESYHAAEGGFDLVLMDLDMPVMDGFRCAREIRNLERRERWEPCLILALSAHAVAEQAGPIREAGMSGQLIKPLSLAALQRALSDFLGVNP